jgi:glycosyltransferase involved in cell wall biosynthesis
MNKLTILTVNLNNSAGLEITMDSVFSQTFTDYEYIIIDGGSTDGSVDLIKKHQNKFVYWVSEKDNGIYSAMNKGIAKASGDYLLFLNSGDYLYNDSVLNKILEKKLSSDIVYGNVVWKPSIPFHEGTFPDKLSFEYFSTYSLPHQASFIRKDLFSIVGLYEETETIISDWLFFLLAIYKFNCSYQHINQTIAVCDTTGISLESANWYGIVEARKEMISKHFAAFDADFETLRNELYSLRNELDLVKRTKGYRTHVMLRNFLKKSFNLKN